MLLSILSIPYDSGIDTYRYLKFRYFCRAWSARVSPPNAELLRSILCWSRIPKSRFRDTWTERMQRRVCLRTLLLELFDVGGGIRDQNLQFLHWFAELSGTQPRPWQRLVRGFLQTLSTEFSLSITTNFPTSTRSSVTEALIFSHSSINSLDIDEVIPIHPSFPCLYASSTIFVSPIGQ